MESTASAGGQIIHLNYTGAKFHRRVFANLTDFIIFALMFVGLFLGIRSIIMGTPSYRAQAQSYLQLKLGSGLYMPKDDDCQDTVAYLIDEKNNYSGYAKKNLAVQSIDKFFVFVGEQASEATVDEIKKDYDSYRLQTGFQYNGVPYFVMEAGEIKENPNCEANNRIWFENVYAPYINGHLHGYLLSRVPKYLEGARFESNIVIWAEIAPAYAFSGILTYLVPPLFLRRGRMTLGKAMYHIGLANEHLLSCSLPRYLGRFGIFYFGVLLLAPFTVGLSFLLSFSLMAFSKNKQGFPDYMMKLREIDLTRDKLYFDYAEISLDSINGSRGPVDFHPTYED